MDCTAALPAEILAIKLAEIPITDFPALVAEPEESKQLVPLVGVGVGVGEVLPPPPLELGLPALQMLFAAFNFASVLSKFVAKPDNFVPLAFFIFDFKSLIFALYG